jgi:hypothetical protein
MYQTSRVLLALVAVLSIGCSKQAIDVGDSTDAGSGGTGGGSSGNGPFGGFGGQKTSSSSSGWTTFSVLQAPERSIDILFVVDNSPSMDPKQKALAENFPKMMESLQKLEGGMPDVHIGVVSSDMSAGAGEAGGNCMPVLGNQGILWGNDPDRDSYLDNNKYASVKNINNGCGMASGARWIQDILNKDGLTRDTNYTGNLTAVFSCLAKAVGTGGCGYEHTLQSLRVALNPADNINPQNFKFLRSRAFLGIVIVSDEDDCSADPSSETNDGMFFPRTLGDTASLRCATRGHVCNGQAIPNYDPNIGYTGTAPFVAKFADCDAKDDGTGVRNYKALPLIRIRDLIDSVKQVKNRPDEQILVTGIIGWPENADLSTVEYRIDKDTTSMPVEQQKLWDYMPICKIPDQKSGDGNIYKAYAGYRLKKFIDGFGSNGQVYSICNTTGFANAMQQIGNALVRRMKPGCVRNALVDSNPDLPETQPQCTVVDKISCDTPGEGNCLTSGYQEIALAQCIDPTTGNPLSPSSPAKTNIPDDARPCWYLVYDTNPNTGCTEAPLGQRITALRKGDGATPPGTLLQLTCRTCDSASDLLCASH